MQDPPTDLTPPDVEVEISNTGVVPVKDDVEVEESKAPNLIGKIFGKDS